MVDAAILKKSDEIAALETVRKQSEEALSRVNQNIAVANKSLRDSQASLTRAINQKEDANKEIEKLLNQKNVIFQEIAGERKKLKEYDTKTKENISKVLTNLEEKERKAASDEAKANKAKQSAQEALSRYKAYVSATKDKALGLISKAQKLFEEASKTVEE